MKKYCKYCHSKLEEGSNYCTNCGKKQSRGYAVPFIIAALGIFILFRSVSSYNEKIRSEKSEYTPPERKISSQVSETTTEEVTTTTEETTTTAAETTTAEILTEPPTTEETRKEIEVEIEPSYEFIDDKLFVTINTNLPDDTSIIIKITNYYDFTAQSKAVVKDGVAVSEGFSNKGERLDDFFEVSVSTSMASLQSKSVIDVIGEKGEFLTGRYVEKDSSGGNVVSAEFDFDTFDLESPESAPTEPPTQASQLGKNVDELSSFMYHGDVRNDVTGKWRYAVCADAGKNIAEYALSYYNKYMSDGEIHAIINFSDRTTTKIVQAIDPDKIALTVYDYVDGEEHDAKLMFGGNIIAYYMVNKNTGEITNE